MIVPEHVVHIEAADAAKRAPDFLMKELPDRLQRGPVTFRLKAQLASPGDPTSDPSRPWPEDRTMVELGMLTLDRPARDSAEAEKALLYLPSQIPTPEEVQRAVGRLASGSRFSVLAREFFARLTQRTLSYFLSRELANHIGLEERFANDGERAEFDDALDGHCREASRIVESFAGGWFGKNVSRWLRSPCKRKSETTLVGYV